MSRSPLQGIVVVSIEQAVAAPFATRQLADLGARVIKIERPEGDFARRYDTSVNGESSYFVWLNRSKESVALDLKNRDDLAILKNALTTADVFVQNLAPGAVARLGLGAEALLDLNPRLIYVSISGYGEGGSYENKKAYDLLIQCESGLLSVTGTESEMSKVGISIADIAAGMYAYSGILAAIIQRAVTGRGDIIEVSMLEALGEWMQQPELYAHYSGAAQPRAGARHATIAPYGPVNTSDGIVFFGVQNEREWVNFCEKVIGSPELADDPRFSDNTARVANRIALDTIVEATCRVRSTAETIALLEDAGIANAELKDIAALRQHPQLAARERWIEVGTPGGPVTVQRPPVTSAEQAFTVGPVPSIGSHTSRFRSEFQ
ncbi:MAG: CaiB/BaiF CoA transferase family protein [Microbacteriaceae bacterium]